MSYAILLYFDTDTENTLQGLIEALANQDGIGETLPPGFRPHITLAGFEPPLPTRLMPALEDIARSRNPLSIHLMAAGVFPGDQGVVYLAPGANSHLLELHHELFHLLQEFDVITNPNFKPGIWVPHCSVAYNLDLEQACQAIHVCLSAPVFNAGKLVSIGITEFVPIKELCIYPFVQKDRFS